MRNNINFEGKFGLERETLRVDKSGRLSQRAHPFADDCFSRDFAENQLEIVTPVCNNTQELLDTIARLDQEAREALAKQNETLWLCSNPPYFESEDEIPIANYEGENAHRKQYREYLSKRYGKKVMLYCGIHFNFSFAENISAAEYFKIFKYLNLYSYVLVMLTSASPVFDGSLEGKEGKCFDGYASRRNGKKGYWNKFTLILDYRDVDSYVKSIDAYIKSGKLYSSAELYMPVRVKTKNPFDDIHALAKDGINHIELRMFDVNPLAPCGVKKEDLDFAHYMMLYFLSKPDFNYSIISQYRAIRRHKLSAKYNPPKRIVTDAKRLLCDMKKYFEGYPDVCDNIDYQLDKLINNNRYCVELLKNSRLNEKA